MAACTAFICTAQVFSAANGGNTTNEFFISIQRQNKEIKCLYFCEVQGFR